MVGPNLGLDLVHSHENVASPAGPDVSQVPLETLTSDCAE